MSREPTDEELEEIVFGEIQQMLTYLTNLVGEGSHILLSIDTQPHLSEEEMEDTPTLFFTPGTPEDARALIEKLHNMRWGDADVTYHGEEESTEPRKPDLSVVPPKGHLH